MMSILRIDILIHLSCQCNYELIYLVISHCGIHGWDVLLESRDGLDA
jgi:hypothetical protein